MSEYCISGDVRSHLVATLQNRVPDLLAIYAFGSRLQGVAYADSDLDLAVLVAGYVDPVLLWDLASDLAGIAGCDVDLLDFQRISEGIRHQILATGAVWWKQDEQSTFFDDVGFNQENDQGDTVCSRYAATIGHRVARVREEYAKDPTTFASDFTRQDAAILNIQRACEAALDMGQHLVRREKLGIPQSARDVFTLLAQAGWIDRTLAEQLHHMVGFRNIAVHDYQTLLLPITVRVIEAHLDEFLHYSQALLLRDAKSGRGHV